MHTSRKRSGTKLYFNFFLEEYFNNSCQVGYGRLEMDGIYEIYIIRWKNLAKQYKRSGTTLVQITRSINPFAHTRHYWTTQFYGSI